MSYVIYTRYMHISGFCHTDTHKGVPTPYLALAKQFESEEGARRYLITNSLHDETYAIMKIVEKKE